MSQRNFTIIAASALATLIGAIGKRKVALDKAVQDAAVQCVAQSIEHRNATPAMSLFDALAGSMRRDALVVYLERFGNLKWNREEKKLAFFENPKVAELDKAAQEAWYESATETLWYSLKKEPVIKSEYDADEMISGVFDRLRKLAKRGSKIINGEVLTAVESAYAQFKAAQLQAETTPELKDALDARSVGRATPAQLAMLTEHFARPIGQVKAA